MTPSANTRALFDITAYDHAQGCIGPLKGFKFSTDMFTDLQDCPKLARWWQHAKGRPSIRTASESGNSALDYDEYLIWVYERYADASAKSTSAADFKDR